MKLIAEVLVLMLAGIAEADRSCPTVNGQQQFSIGNKGTTNPLCQSLPANSPIPSTTTIVPASSTSTTLAGVITSKYLRTTGAGSPTDGLTRDGDQTMNGCARATHEGDNRNCAEVVDGAYDDARRHWFSSLRISQPYGTGSDVVNSQADIPSRSNLGPAILDTPTAPPNVTQFSTPNDMFHTNWEYSFTYARCDTTWGHCTDPSPGRVVKCTQTPACGFTISVDASAFAPPWYGNGQTEIRVYTGGGDANFYQWGLDWLITPADTITIIDTNGELETANPKNMSGPGEIEDRDPVLTNSYRSWKGGDGICVSESVYGPQLTTNAPALRYRWLIDGVHCDVACRNCSAARGVCSSFSPTPPSWPQNSKHVCDSNGVRFRRIQLVGANEDTMLAPGTCGHVWHTLGGQPTLGICDSGDGRGPHLVSIP